MTQCKFFINNIEIEYSDFLFNNPNIEIISTALSSGVLLITYKELIKKKSAIKGRTLFKDSPIFNKKEFKNSFPDWSKDKLAFYYDAVLTWSNEGNMKKDWVATVRTWANRDEKQGKIKFDIVKTGVIPNAIV